MRHLMTMVVKIFKKQTTCVVLLIILLEYSHGCLNKYDCFAKSKKGRLPGNTLRTLTGSGYIYCYLQCTGRAGCQSFNYNYYDGTCELKTVVEGPGHSLVDEEGYIYSLIPPALPADYACSHNPCPTNNLCYPLTLTGRACQAECSSPQNNGFATVSALPEGALFSSGTEVTYTCNSGFAGLGSLSSRCLSTGTWSGAVQCSQICDYESTCTPWTVDNTVDQMWQVITGSTPSDNTGANGDHTSGSGSYIYFEGSNPAVQGEIARLCSPVIPANTKICLDLWYHMYGWSMGSLRIRTKETGGTWTLQENIATGDQGGNWKSKTVTIPAKAHSYRIGIEGVRGSSSKSDICLDDIRYYSC